MDSKYFTKIINEEVSNFDFLNNEKYLKEQETIDLLRNDDLQKQFICDSLLNKNTKIKILKGGDAFIGGDWDESIDDASILTIQFHLEMQYLYDQSKEPLVFNLDFDSDGISISKNSDYNGGTLDNDVAPSGGDWFDGFNWNDIEVKLWTLDGDEILFTAFDKAPTRIKTLFIRQYTENFIESKSLKIRTKEMKDNVQNISYC